MDPKKLSPKLPTVDSIAGWWAYSLQGFMWAQNALNGKSLDTSKLTYKVNQAGYGGLLPVSPGPPPVPPPLSLPAPIPLLPELDGYRPDAFAVPYPKGSQAGYYPFSEIGYVIFGVNGSVDGWFRVNDAGYDSDDNGHFRGSYKLDANGVTGVYTIQLDDFHNHVWDYHFVTVTDKLILLQAAKRLPRPALGTGTLRLMG
jgi:hypothetical protein